MVKKIRKKILGFVLTLCILMSLIPTHVNAAGSGGPTLGQINMFPYNFAPRNWSDCSGQLVTVSSNNALFSLLGNTFGGDGSSNFALPNLVSANPYSAQYNYTPRYCIATNGIWGFVDSTVIGEVCLLPDSIVTRYAQSSGVQWLKCDGSSYNLTTYAALNAAIGSKFGNALPDLSHSSPIAGVSYYIACEGNAPSSNFAMDEFLGAIDLVAFSSVPEGMVPCDGRTLQIVQNAALFSLIGNSFGGDGMTTFCVPDMRGLAPLPGLTYYISLEGIFPSRS
jgi:microcystin-dependent protein